MYAWFQGMCAMPLSFEWQQKKQKQMLSYPTLLTQIPSATGQCSWDFFLQKHLKEWSF